MKKTKLRIYWDKFLFFLASAFSIFVFVGANIEFDNIFIAIVVTFLSLFVPAIIYSFIMSAIRGRNKNIGGDNERN